MWQMSGLCWVRIMFGGMVPPLMLSPSMSAYTLVELFEVFLMCLSMMRRMCVVAPGISVEHSFTIIKNIISL